MRMPAYALLLTLMALPPAAGAASKSKMPALLERAQYVALGYDLGDGFVSADRTSRRSPPTPCPTSAARSKPSARTSRSGAATPSRTVPSRRRSSSWCASAAARRLEVGGGDGNRGVSMGETANGRIVSSRTVGGQLSSPDDRVDVYEAASGRPGIRLWSGAEVGGMAGSPPRLYKSFREEVEAATKKP